MMKKRITVVAWFLSILHIAPAGAFVENPCRKVLAEGFYNEYLRSNAKLRDRAMYAELCASSFQYARDVIKRAQKLDSDGSTGISYGLFSPEESEAQSRVFVSNGSLGEDRFNQWKSAYCSRNLSADSSRAAEFLMQKAVTQSVVNAWTACMRKREGLACWATPRDDGFLLNINWTMNGPLQPQVEHSFLSRGAIVELEGVPARRILPVGYKLNQEALQIPVTRTTQTDSGIIANLKVNHGGVEHSCNVFIPGDRDFALRTPFVAQ